MSNRLGDNPAFANLLQQVTTVSINENPINEPVVQNLTEVYEKRYVKPSSDVSAIAALGDIFRDLIGECTIEVRDGIGEYYRILMNRGLPAFEWLLEAFHVASKKDDQKRNFRYVVGMVRQWMKFGFGHIPSEEEQEVITYFEEVTGSEVTAQTRLLLQNLMGNYGAIKVTRMIGSLERDHDFSLLIASVLKNTMEDKFPDLKNRYSTAS